jgi:hypothetical protein
MIEIATVGARFVGLDIPRDQVIDKNFTDQLKKKICKVEPRFKHYRMVLINCLPFYNPAATNHSGEHVQIIENIMHEGEFAKILKYVKDTLNEMYADCTDLRMPLFVLWCKSGRHRSVGFAAILRFILGQLRHDVPATTHMSSCHWHPKFCHMKCKLCQPSSRKQAALEYAFELFSEL